LLEVDFNSKVIADAAVWGAEVLDCNWRVIGPEAAVRILFKHEMETMENPEEFLHKKQAEMRRVMSGPYLAAAIEEVDEVIEPRETRPRLIDALKVMANKQETRHYRKHGIMPV